MIIKSPTKGIKTVCEKLGDKYTIKVFDMENVIYRDLGNGYDIEVSGLDNNRKDIDAVIYVWNNIGKSQIIEIINNIKSIEQLKDVLNACVVKYQHLQ